MALSIFRLLTKNFPYFMKRRSERKNKSVEKEEPAAIERSSLPAVLGVVIFLAAAIWLVFGQTRDHGFVNFDDDAYVYGNPAVFKGLTPQAFVWAFTQTHSDNWHPLTWLSHMLDCQWYGLHPAGHHLTSVLFHTVNAVLLFLLLRQMTGFFWRSAFIAALFAVHPLRVESVAWIAERKDVLSGFFFLLTLLAYVRYARLPWSFPRYTLVFVLFSLGLMAKPILITLPFILCLLDYWPLRRWPANFLKDLKKPGSVSLKLLLEKIPLLALAAVSAVITLAAQKVAIGSFDRISFPLRLANAVDAYAVYLHQLVYPAKLAVFYPYPLSGLNTTRVVSVFFLLAALSWIAWSRRHRQPFLWVGWLWYLVILGPVIGLIQVGEQAHADRYTYLPHIGVVIALTWWIAEQTVAGQHRRWLLGMLAMPAIFGAAFLARLQVSYWKDSETLWTHALACTTNNAVAHNSLGNVLETQGKFPEALSQFKKAIELHPSVRFYNNLAVVLIKNGNGEAGLSYLEKILEIAPDYADAYNNFSVALGQAGRFEEALRYGKKALELNPDYTDAYNNCATIFQALGQPDQALLNYQKALEINPNHGKARYNLATALFNQGAYEQAAGHYRKVLELEPDYAEAHHQLALTLSRLHQDEEAIAHDQRALELNPVYTEAQNSLAGLLASKGRLKEMIRSCLQATKIRPRDATLHYNLALALFDAGEIRNAAGHYEMALDINPTYVAALNNLAWIRATHPDPSLRNGRQAVTLSEEANRLSDGKNPALLETLAASYAEAGRFSEAVRVAKKAISLAQAADKSTESLKRQETLYLERKPFREAFPGL
jgi:tetratricopeptide (TPR) repeat protein